MIAGDLHDQRLLSQDNRVYSTKGCSPSINTLIGEKRTKIQVAGTLGKKTQHYTVYGGGGVSPTIASCDWKDPVKVIVPRGD